MSGYLQNIAITMLPVLIYQIYWSKIKTPVEQSKTHKIVIGVVSILSIVLSMTYPFYTQSGLVFDLRLIPLSICILYGESVIGLLTILVFVLYRYYVGGPVVITAIFLDPILLLPFFLIVKNYKSFGYKKRTTVGTILLSITFILKCIYSYLFIPRFASIIDYGIVSFFLLTHVLVMFASLYLIERSRFQILLEHRVHQSEKYEVVSHLAASIAHEVRNPLTVIRGFLQFIDYSTDVHKFNFYRTLMLDELERAETIISDYLMFAKPEIGTKESVNVAEVINIALNIVNSYAISNKIDVKCNFQDTLHIYAEKSKLVQVLVNIVKNAIEAMPNGGTITISSNREKNNVYIKIMDQGIGMTQEQLNRLGQPYFSTKEKGTGLGLMVSYKIIETLHGEITVNSTKGEGSEFTIYLPLTSEISY